MVPVRPHDGLNGRANELEGLVGAVDDSVRRAEVLAMEGHGAAALAIANAASEVFAASVDREIERIAAGIEQLERSAVVGCIADWDCDL